ncbi:hypothetical protein [Mycetocola zhujimingii]|uniref:Uncharacterized protein n=1 Tax=Mycetocola zhujimingii TaxID=2079792 RepID=A0A2U1TDE5_9MICO|nr:hypothetical protein [Mycetocola zhujimingii]PWC06912.1 hypothetical protein DF223_07980 [Mycetocola zhujimingii]
MKTTLATDSVRHDHPPQTPASPQPAPTSVRRVGLVDRAALHLGVALVKWGRRPVKATRHRRAGTQVDDVTRRDVAEAEKQREELRDQFLALFLFR